MTPKLSNLKIVLGYWNENSDSCFRFNNPKQFSNWIILVSFCSSHLAINCYNVSKHQTTGILAGQTNISDELAQIRSLKETKANLASSINEAQTAEKRI